MRRFLSIAALFLVSSSALATESMPLSLHDAAEVALENHPRVRQARAATDTAEGELKSALSTWLPSISLAETWTRGDNPIFVFGSLLEQGRFTQANFDLGRLNHPDAIDNYRLSADLQFTIFDQLRRHSQIGMAKLGVEQAVEGYSAVEQRLRVDVIRAYFGVALSEAARDVYATAVRAAESDVESIRDRYEVGLVVESDLLAAEVHLAEFRQQLIAEEGSLVVSRALLASLLGLPLDAAPRLTDRLGDAKFDTPTLESLIAASHDERPEMKNVRLAERSVELGVRAAKGQYLPRVDAFASYGASGSTIDDQSSDSLVGLRFSWSLLQPGRQGAFSSAKAELAASRAEKELLEDQVAIEVIRAWQHLRTAEQSVELALASVSQARESMRIVRDRYSEGLITITEQLRAQTALNRAEVTLLSARFDYYLGYAELMRASGRLHDVPAF